MFPCLPKSDIFLQNQQERYLKKSWFVEPIYYPSPKREIVNESELCTEILDLYQLRKPRLPNLV